jgi:phage terminase large subunit-like protein
MWLPPGAWAACTSDDQIPAGVPIFLGLDLGFKNDHTAVVEVYPIDGKFVCRVTIFATHSDPSKPAPLAHRIFESETQSHRAVVDHILEVSKRNPITELVYDPYGAMLIIEELESAGITCVEFPQTNQRMCKATDLLYGLITTELLKHDGDEAFAAHIDACTTKWVGDGLRLWKDKDRSPMDSGIALAVATHRAYTVGTSEFNFWPLG